MKHPLSNLVTILSLALLLSCAPPPGTDQPGPIPPKPIPDENQPPVKQEASCDAIVGLKHGTLVAPSEAVRRARAFLVRGFATFMATTSPDGTRRFMGVRGTLVPIPGNLEATTAVYTGLCYDTPMSLPAGSVVVKQVVPRPEIRLFNTNEFQAFMALAPESIWGDGTLDGSLIPTLEWNLGTGWRMTMTASRESFRTDLFSMKKWMDAQRFGGKASMEIFDGAEKGSFVLVYTIDARVNGKPARVRQELEYVGI